MGNLRLIESIVERHECCGCGACVQRCPQKCISLDEDREGFLYPVIQKDRCIDCGVCDKVCPALSATHRASHAPLSVYAAFSKDESVRMQSSSGGVFSLLAEDVVNRGGVVFGARFDDDWQVMLAAADTLQGIAAFRGSKYVQARTENTFVEAESYLKQGREVLFSGTPCQIAGLKSFLRREYDNLCTVDCACYGVPSPKVWGRYMEECTENHTDTISSITFRDKRSGWKNYSFTLACHSRKDGIGDESSDKILSESRSENIYLRSFNLMLRPSCFQCKMKGMCSSADITLADFWGIEKYLPDMNDDKGVGLVIIHSAKGKEMFPYEQTHYKEFNIKQGIAHNGGFDRCATPHAKRKQFFDELDKADSLHTLLDKMHSRSFTTVLRDKIQWTLYKILTTIQRKYKEI